MPGYIRVEVEQNDNSLMTADQVYRSIGVPFMVRQVRIYEGEPEGKLCNIAGWSGEDGGRPVEAYAVQIEDSSQGVAYLVYGGPWGVRLAPVESYAEGSEAAWSMQDTDQWGETHLIMADLEDIVPA